MAGSHVAHAAYKGPSVVKEILIRISLVIVAGGFWKMHHWNNQRRTKEFYDLLEKDEISVVKNLHHWNNQRRNKEFYDLLEKDEISVVNEFNFSQIL